MNAYTTVKSTGADAIIPIYSIADLLDIMIYFQQKTIKSKEEQILYNFTNFDCDPKLSRKLENATGTSALILDNDGDGISYKEFMLTFQKCKMIISNTFSSTGMRERWRVIIPLARTVSVDEHDQLYALVLAELQKAGYPLDKRDPSRPYDQSHGFDTSKRTIVSIVYLPSQAKDPQGSFFEAAIGADREIFDPDAWLSCLPPVPAPSVVSSLPKSAPAATTAGNKLDGAIKEWRSVGCLPGQGNQGFKKLAIAAHRAGLSEREITDLLEQQAAFANSPEDRRKEIGSLISWMKVKLQR